MVSTASPSAAQHPETAYDLRSLTFRVESFADDHLPLVARFSERYWLRPRTAAYYRWRYLDAEPFSRHFLALTDDECLGMVFALRKQYVIDGQGASCLEVFDWHSLPQLRGSGVGIRLMRAMMRTGERLIAIGGTRDAVSALPVMGWQRIGSARSFELPLAAEPLNDSLQRRLPVPVPGARVALRVATRCWFRPRRRMVRGVTVPVPLLTPDLQALYEPASGYDVMQVPNPELFDWMHAGADITGAYSVLKFMIDDELRGWALTRVYPTPQGTEAAILDLYAPRTDVALYTWMVSEAATSLLPARPARIRARATCPILQAALRANRFRAGDEAPIHTWPATLRAGMRLHITLNHTDEPLRPYRVR